jgi:DNA-binding LytR/AlgR family response regulator
MPTALIAEDEPLLAADLQSALRRAWPELRIVATATHGESAVSEALALAPDVVFMDIRMPGMTGLEAAQALAEDWPDDPARPFPLVVFVTAYDQYALQAFERAAFDYLLKPVAPERLAAACARLRSALQQRTSAAPQIDAVVRQLRDLVGPGSASPAAGRSFLKVIQAAVGSAVHLVPVDEVLYFEAADKYVRVVTAGREHLIRTSLRELQPQLDPDRFWQIHRGTIVRCDAIETAIRNESGKATLTLRGHPDKLVVSRLYAHLFKPM